MEEVVRFNAATPGGADVDTESLPRCEHALELLLTHRGNPSAEVDRVLAGDPLCVFGHCLRAAIIVRADDGTARSTLAASVAAIEPARPDMTTPRAVTRPQRVLGSRAIRLLRSNVTAPSSPIARATFSRSWSRIRSIFASAGGA